MNKPTSKQRLRLYKRTLKQMLANPTWGSGESQYMYCLCKIMLIDINKLTGGRKWLDDLPDNFSLR